MEQETFKGYVRQVSKNTGDEDVSLLTACAQRRDLRKGAALLREGEVCRAFYLVEKGYLRTYYSKDGDIINLNFALEGDFITNIKSFRSHEVSEVTIAAGEDAVVWVYDLDSIAREYDSHPAIVLFIRRLGMHLFMIAEENSNLFKLYTPTERYRYIEQHKPELLQRVSLSQLASYIGVSRETLSRIRGKKD